MDQWTPRSLSLYFLFQSHTVTWETMHMVRRIRFIYLKIVVCEVCLISWLQYAVNILSLSLTHSHSLPFPPFLQNTHTHTHTHRVSSYLTTNICVCLENTVQTENSPEMLYWQSSLSSCVYSKFPSRHAGCGPQNHVAYLGYHLPFEYLW